MYLHSSEPFDRLPWLMLGLALLIRRTRSRFMRETPSAHLSGRVMLRDAACALKRLRRSSTLRYDEQKLKRLKCHLVYTSCSTLSARQHKTRTPLLHSLATLFRDLNPVTVVFTASFQVLALGGQRTSSGCHRSTTIAVDIGSH